MPNLVIYNLITCCTVNRGNIYLEKTYINTINVNNVKENWFIKWNGNNWGIINIFVMIRALLITYI